MGKAKGKARLRRLDGEGSVYLDKARGIWRAAVTPPKDWPDQRRRYGSGRTQEEAIAARDRIRDEMRAPAAGPAPTLAEFIPLWRARKVAAGRRETTMRSYESAIKLYIEPGLGRVLLPDLNPLRLQSWADQLSARGLSASQVRRIFTVVGSILSQAARLQLISQNTAALVELPAYVQPPARWISTPDVARLLDAAARVPDGALLAVLVTTGLRIGEAGGLRREDVDLVTGELHVAQQVQRLRGRWVTRPPKYGSARRVYAPDILLPILAAHLATLDAARLPDWPMDLGDLIFRRPNGDPIHPNTTRHRLRRLLAAAGLPPVTPHQLRHSAGSMAREAGVDLTGVQHMLGHRTSQPTSRIYVHVGAPSMRDSAQRIGRAIGDQNRAKTGPIAARTLHDPAADEAPEDGEPRRGGPSRRPTDSPRP